MKVDWTEGSWVNGNPVLEPLKDNEYIWLCVRGSGNYQRLVPYQGSPDFYLATQYHASKDPDRLRWWWAPMMVPENLPDARRTKRGSKV